MMMKMRSLGPRIPNGEGPLHVCGTSKQPPFFVQNREARMCEQHRVDLGVGSQVGIGYIRIGGEIANHRPSVPFAAIFAQEIPRRHVADAQYPSIDQAIDIGGTEKTDDVSLILEHAAAIRSVVGRHG
jgi:hypothetical protein